MEKEEKKIPWYKRSEENLIRYKEYQKEYHKKWYKKNREKIKESCWGYVDCEYQKNYYQKNRENIIARQNIYNKKNAELISARNKKIYKEKKENNISK